MAGGFALTCVSWICLGTTLILQEQGAAVPGWVSVVAIVVSVFAYAAGVMPTTYVLLAEIFNFQVSIAI